MDALLLDLGDEKPDPVDEVPATATSAVARVGDLFCLGPHRLFVGDARRPEAYASLMQGECARMGSWTRLTM